jgi:hypothetical protein
MLWVGWSFNITDHYRYLCEEERDMGVFIEVIMYV